MNNDRRNRIANLAGRLQDLLSEVEIVRDEEQEYYDNMPESLQGSERGLASEDAISNLESATSDLSSVIEALENIE